MESLHLSKTFAYLKFKSKAPYKMYFKSQVCRKCTKKSKKGIFFYFSGSYSLSRDGTPIFYHDTIFEIIFRRYTSIWPKGK